MLKIRNPILIFVSTMSVEVTNLAIREIGGFEQHIESVTSYRFNDRSTVRFIPEGRVELLFQIGSRFLHRTPADGSWVVRPPGFVGGLHDHAYHVKPLDGQASCIGIKFKPGSAQYFMRCSQSSLRNKVMSIENVWGDTARAIQTAINTSSANELAARLRPFLRAQYVKPSEEKQVFITEAISGTVDKKRIKALALEMGLSASHFRKRFKDMVGLSPIQYGKVLSIGRAIDHLQDDDYESLTSLAMALGYYDQAHFIRTFRSITGEAPSQFLETL